MKLLEFWNTHCCLHTPWECSLDLVIFLQRRNWLTVQTNQTACFRMVRPWTWCGRCFGDNTYLSGSHMIDKILYSLFWSSCKKTITVYCSNKNGNRTLQPTIFFSQLQGLVILLKKCRILRTLTCRRNSEKIHYYIKENASKILHYIFSSVLNISGTWLP